MIFFGRESNIVIGIVLVDADAENAYRNFPIPSYVQGHFWPINFFFYLIRFNLLIVTLTKSSILHGNRAQVLNIEKNEIKK